MGDAVDREGVTAEAAQATAGGGRRLRVPGAAASPATRRGLGGGAGRCSQRGMGGGAAAESGKRGAAAESEWEGGGGRNREGLGRVVQAG
jgi:hypothetical protein